MSTLAGLNGSTGAVFARSAREGLRDPGPALFLPALPPLLLVVALTSLFEGLAGVIRFPAASFAEYFVPGAVMIVAIAGAGSTSAQIADDLRSGFVERLRLQSGHPISLLLGRFAFEAVRIVPGLIAVITVGVLFGGTLGNGPAGVIAIMALAMMLSVAYAGLFYVVAILTEDPQTPLNLNPLGIILAFLSSAFVPRSAMPAWADTVAGLNPLTVLMDGARAAMIGDIASADVASAFAVGVVGVALSLVVSTTVLTRKFSKG